MKKEREEKENEAVKQALEKTEKEKQEKLDKRNSMMQAALANLGPQKKTQSATFNKKDQEENYRSDAGDNNSSDRNMSLGLPEEEETMANTSSIINP